MLQLLNYVHSMHCCQCILHWQVSETQTHLRHGHFMHSRPYSLMLTAASSASLSYASLLLLLLLLLLSHAYCMSVGFLYPPGDYEQAIKSTHQLVSDSSFRKTMAGAARAEVERFGWNAAISRVRNLQYQRAIRIYKAHKRYPAATGGPCSNACNHAVQCQTIRRGK